MEVVFFIPVYKFDDLIYRELSSHFVKRFETVLYIFIYKHVLKFLSVYQLGFINKHSTKVELFAYTRSLYNIVDKDSQVNVL